MMKLPTVIMYHTKDRQNVMMKTDKIKNVMLKVEGHIMPVSHNPPPLIYLLSFTNIQSRKKPDSIDSDLTFDDLTLN